MWKMNIEGHRMWLAQLNQNLGKNGANVSLFRSFHKH